MARFDRRRHVDLAAMPERGGEGIAKSARKRQQA
jgi:hypothetical protein